jgi:hypothetical protein
VKAWISVDDLSGRDLKEDDVNDLSAASSKQAEESAT